MAQSFRFPAWVCEAIACVAEIPQVQLSLVILEGQRRIAPPSPPKAPLERMLAALADGSALAKIKARFDFANGRELFLRYRDWQSRRGRIPAEQLQDLSELLRGVDQIRCDTLAKGRFAEIFRDADVEQIKAYDLDVILKFGFNIVHGQVLEAARHGVWSYHHDDHLRYRGGPPGFWEVYFGDPETGAMLQRINEKLDDGLVLHKEFFRTRLDSYSHNLHRIWTGSASWPALCCLKLLAQDRLESVDPVKSSAPVYKVPRNHQMVSFAGRLLKRKVQSRFGPRGPLQEHWAIGWMEAPASQLVTGQPLPAPRWIVSEPGSFCADPFVWRHGQRDYLFFERFDYSTGLGSIGFTSTADWRDFDPVEIVLGGPGEHYSYPLVFGHEERFYAIPEQVFRGCVELYELTHFPRGWRRLSVLLPDFAGVDSTLFQHDGLWWLLAGGLDKDKDTLHGFFAETPFGPWKAHPANPLVATQARRSRPAGRVFRQADRLYRPAQYGHRYYGYGLLLYRIDLLNPLEYRESLVSVRLPWTDTPFGDGVHHLEIAQDRLIFDAKRHFHGSKSPALPAQATLLRLG